MIISRIAHASFRVTDLEAAIEFYGNLLGLAVRERRDDRVFMGSGKSASYELEFTKGPNQLDHFAFGVRGLDALEEARRRLKKASVDVVDSSAGDQPGLQAGIAFSLPSGHAMELVVESAPVGFVCDADAAPQHHRVVGPVSLEHINCLTPNIRTNVEFLCQHLDWRLTDSWQPSPDEPWRTAWLRAGELHHDVAFIAADISEPKLHHFCFAVPAVADLVRLLDALSARGVKPDSSIGRHVAGNNVFLYFKDPFGNRCEVNAEMARIDPAAPPRISRETFRFDAWGQERPADLGLGSPCRDTRKGAA